MAIAIAYTIEKAAFQIGKRLLFFIDRATGLEAVLCSEVTAVKQKVAVGVGSSG